jgi:hypothetical protein
VAVTPEQRRASAERWLIVATGIIASTALLLFARSSRPESGDVVSVAVTVVPRDSTGLACDSTASIGGLRCTHAAGKPVSSLAPPLRPYVTVRRELVLLSGVFESPNVKDWLNQAVRQHNSGRVTVVCKVELLPTPGKVGVRFGGRGPFAQQQQPILAGRIRECRVKAAKQSPSHGP